MPKTLWSFDSVYFRDTKHGWTAGFRGQILRSRDGGVTWQEQASPSQAWLKSVVFDDSGRGWIAADNQLLVSEDGGETWRSISVEGRLFLHQVLPVKDSLWAVGHFGVLRQAAAEPRLTVLTTLPGGGETALDK